MKISTILDKIDENQLFIPAFQREYVWKRDDAKLLMDSLIKEYPTGTMLTWETSNPPELKGAHKYQDAQGAVKLLLDGQQRITTLYMLIRGDLPPYYTAAEITKDPRSLYVNVETLELSYYQKIRMKDDPRWRDITDIFQRKIRVFDIVRDLERHGVVVDRKLEECIDTNMSVIGLITERPFPEQIIPVNATIREAIDIFYKVNASGVSLTDAELALAQISGYWPEARDTFKAKLSELAGQGFVLKLDFIVYALLGCMYHMGSDMSKLHGGENREEIQKVWAILDKKILDYVMNFLRTRAFVDHTSEINSIYAVIPIIVFFFDKRDETVPDEQLWRIVKWFYYSQVRARYVSQLAQKLDFDLRITAESERPFEELLTIMAEERRLEILPDEFVGRSVSHPFFALMRWYLKSREAICLSTGLGIRQNMGKDYQLESDHIFPYSRLKEKGYGLGNRIKYALAQEFTNRAILTRDANRKKAAKPPADYLNETDRQFPGALEKQCIPLDKTLWEMDCYQDFLTARRKLLAEQLNGYLAGLTTPEDEEFGVITLEERIAGGESDELEFKSSLRWDYREGRVNKMLETVVVKTVAAFANSDGGYLLVGVDDSGMPLGLDNDYASLNGDRDRFELHLRNLLNKYFDKAFVANCITITFPIVGNNEVCQIDVSPSSKPCLVKINGSHGAVHEKFYVRSGNSSQELSMSEFDSYRAERFG